jgi:pimeloyl-ACP methyl ester carboxylesterase
MLGLKSRLLLLVTAGSAGARAATLESGSLNEAPFAVAVPDEGRWNHGIVLLAHDRRNPALSPIAVDPTESELGRTLVSQGWIVAASGYRRNGIIITDAVSDLLDLRRQIGAKHGSVNRTIVVGDGLGGFVAALMAEAIPDLVTGAVAIDPPLTVHESNQSLGLSLDPKIPLVLVATAKEPLAEATAYKTAPMPRPPEDPLPALLTVEREGRDNVNDGERLAAFRILNTWLEKGAGSLPPTVPNQPYADITVAPPDHPKKIVAEDGQPGFTAHVIAVDPLTGSLQLDARPADLNDLKVEPMGFFEATVGPSTYRVIRQGRGVRLATPGKKKKKTLLTLFSKQKGQPGRVNPGYRGEWFAYDDAEGYVTLAHFDEDATPTSPLQVGDAVAIAPCREGDGSPEASGDHGP